MCRKYEINWVYEDDIPLEERFREIFILYVKSRQREQAWKK